MSDDEFTTSIRKFLKHLGVTGHQLIEDELRKAVKDGNCLLYTSDAADE